MMLLFFCGGSIGSFNKKSLHIQNDGTDKLSSWSILLLITTSIVYLSMCMRKPTIWVFDQVNTNQAGQSQKIASFKFQMKEEEGLDYQCSENKGADQLCGYREAGLRLYFRICRLLVFLCSSSFFDKFDVSAFRKKNSILAMILQATCCFKKYI